MSATDMKPKVFGNISMLLAAAAVLQGEIACVNTSGYGLKGAATAGLVAIGIFAESVDNSGGAAGDLSAVVMTSYPTEGGIRVFPLTNSGTDACDQTSVGHSVYIEGPNTVRKTSNSDAAPRAGKCWGFTADGKVLVEFDASPDAVAVDALESDLADLTELVEDCPAMQAVNATLASGTVTINTGITVAADSEVIPLQIAAITGSSNFASLRELKASRVNGAPGVGTIVIQAVGADGALDADAAGAIRVVILTPTS